MDRAARLIAGKFAGQPQMEAAIRATIAETYAALGLRGEARPHAERAVELRNQALGPDHRDTLPDQTRLGPRTLWARKIRRSGGVAN